MAVSTADSLECVICNENLLDPRPLPCGHSYCGPPRLCLFSLENENGGLRCAVCRSDHNLRADEIKPLYGIRDYIQESWKVKLDDSSRLPCTAHPNKDVTLWCSDCSVMVCEDCMEYQHEDHSFRKLKRFIELKFERELGKPFHECISEYRKCLTEIIESTLLELERSKLEVQSMESKLDSLLNQRDLWDQYCKVLEDSSPNLAAKKINLLIKIWETGLVKFPPNTLKCEQESFDRVKLSESSLTDDISITNSADTGSSAVASSTPTAFSRDHATIPQEDNDGKTVFPQPPPKTEVLASSTNISTQTLDINVSTVRKPIARTEIEVCSCGYKHELNAPWSAPVYIFLSLHVIKRKPLRIGPSSEVAFCPFQFLVETELVSAGSGGDKFLRIIVKCLHVFGKSLPSTNLEYKLWLRNLGSRDRDKKKLGTWSNPKSSNLKFDAIRYSELMNPQEKWIQTKRGDDCLEIGLKLMRSS